MVDYFKLANASIYALSFVSLRAHNDCRGATFDALSCLHFNPFLDFALSTQSHHPALFPILGVNPELNQIAFGPRFGHFGRICIRTKHLGDAEQRNNTESMCKG